MRWLEKLRAETVVVHLTEGSSIRGALVGVYADSLVLRAAEFIGRDAGEATRIPIDGEAVIPREKVSWLQHLHGSAGGATS